MKEKLEYLGEGVGTMIMVAIGCSTIAVALLYIPMTLPQVAIIWGIGVALSIYAVRSICPAHLNPAISFSMFLAKKLSLKKFSLYTLSQFIGSLFGGWIVFLLFSPELYKYEFYSGIPRGYRSSYHSAFMFGEYFPNPMFENEISIEPFMACLLEGAGTFFLVLAVFCLNFINKKYELYKPILVGLTIALLIFLIAPYTQGGFNPARDFSPRIIAYFGGWGKAAFPAYPFSFFTVYILSPLIGATLGYYLYSDFLE